MHDEYTKLSNDEGTQKKLDQASDAFSVIDLNSAGWATELLCDGLHATGEAIGELLGATGEVAVSIVEALGDIAN